ncbi:MAG TPA: zeta toxin family protein [Pelovirga sp.]|nr:zeta toxin family protein [Pelovirga sp.]
MLSTHQPVIVVVAGPNGSGKTSLTQDLRLHQWVTGEGCIYVNPDDIAQEVYGDWNSKEATINAANEADRIREQCLEKRNSLVFETVMSAKNKVDFLRRAKDAGYFIRLFFVSTDSPTINAARVAQRVTEGGHTVPIEKIISRYSKSIVNCAVVSRFVNRTYVYDNSVDGQQATRLFRTVEGKVHKVYQENINLWAKIVLDTLEHD